MKTFALMVQVGDKLPYQEVWIEAASLDAAIKKAQKKFKEKIEIIAHQDLSPR